MEIPSGYKFNYQQLNPITYLARVTTPDNLTFSIQAQSQGQPNDNQIFEHLINKQTRNNFIIEIDSEIIKEEIPQEKLNEIKQEINPQV